MAHFLAQYCDRLSEPGCCWTRIAFSERIFAELVRLGVSEPEAGSAHQFEHRLAHVVEGVCVVRYDNELAWSGR